VLPLDGSITNSFAIDRDTAYIVTRSGCTGSSLARRRPAGGVKEGYQNIGIIKPGQLSAGSGTTPTVLDNGKYVAIADNADQMHVVVFRTDERLDPGENRIVCEVPVFKEGEGALDNSLMGSGRSLIVFNNYGYDMNTLMYEHKSPRASRNRPRRHRSQWQGCNNSQPVWENGSVTVIDSGMKLSTSTG